MSKTVICPRGHCWEPTEVNTGASVADEGCPVCRQAGALPPPPLGRATVPEGLWDLLGEKSRGPRVPPTVAGFQILGELGHGGMGVVWTARHVRLKRLVALKQILTADPDLLARLKTEAEAAARLSHPNIVQIHEVVEQDGQQYLALEYVEGGSLQALLADGPVPARRAAALVAGLARAMAYAHGRGVLHRDLKPANVLLKEDGTAKVGDFGLAKQLDDDAGQTKAGAVLGTPSYMAPEQAAGLTGEIGPRSDVYALGAILYECLTGRPPFRAATTLETLQQVRYEDPVPPSRLQPGTPRDIQTISLKCLQKAPARRYATAGELADDLERFLAGEPIRARPVGGAERVWKWARRRPAAAALVVAGLLGAVTFLVGLLWHQRVMSQEVSRANANEAEAHRQREVALEHFRKGHETLDAIFTRLNEDLFRVQDERSRRLQREIAQATLRYYRQVLRNFEDSEPEVQLNRAIVLVYAARIEELLKNVARAEDDYRAAGRLLAQLVREQPDSEHLRCEWATLNYFLGMCYSNQGRREEAAERFRAAVDQATPFPGRKPTERSRTVLGLALGELAWLAGEKRRDVEGRAVEVWTGLVKDYPENRSHRSNLSYALYRQSFPFLSAYDTDAVAPLVLQSESALRHALDGSPREHADITGLNHLAKIHREFGFTLLCKKRYADALDQFDRGVLVFQRLLDHEPMFWDGDVTMSRLHQYRATALEGLGRRDEAVAAWDQALEFAKVAMKHKGSRDFTDICRAELAERFFHHGHYERAVKEAALLVEDSQVSAPIRFLLARTLAEAAWRLGEERRRPFPFIQKEQERLRAMALTALRRCQAAGHFDDPKRVEELKTWTQFAALRERADWQSLLAEVQSRKK